MTTVKYKISEGSIPSLSGAACLTQGDAIVEIVLSSLISNNRRLILMVIVIMESKISGFHSPGSSYFM
jgi:hypothetical protein